MFAHVKKVLRDQRGMSLVEGLVAVGAVAGLAGLIATLSNQIDIQAYTLRRACDSLADSILESVSQEGLYSDVSQINLGQGAPTPGFPAVTPVELTSAQGSALFNNIQIVQNSDLWPATITTTLVGGGPRPVIQTHRTVKGVIRALNGIYNSGDLCTDVSGTGDTWYPYNPITQTDATSVVNLGLTSELFKLPTAPTIGIRLETIDQQEQTACVNVGTWLEIVPPSGLGAQAWDAGSYPGAANPANNSYAGGRPAYEVDNLGYKFNVNIQYAYKGENYECRSAQTYRYYADNQAPTPPNIIEIPTNAGVLQKTPEFPAVAPGVGACETSPGDDDANRLITVRIQSDVYEGGTVLLCRDTSQNMNAAYGPTDDENSISRACFPTANAADVYAVNPDRTALTAQEPAAWVGDNDLDQWVPCHQARICGKVDLSDMTARVVPGAWNDQSGQYQIDLSWDNVPVDCIVGLEVVAVDFAGNFSAPATFNAPVAPATGPILAVGNNILPKNEARVMHRGFCGDTSNPFDLNSSGVSQSTLIDDAVDPTVATGVWCRPPGYTGAPADHYENVAGFGGDLSAGNGPLEGLPAGSSGEMRTWNWSNVPNWGETVGAYAWPPASWPPAAPPADWGSVFAESTDDGSNPLGNGNFTWIDEFPNGYYTCRQGGCCVGAGCTPWSP